MQAAERANDWANLCYFRADNAVLATQQAPTDRIVFMCDSLTPSWLLAHPDFFGPTRVNRGISGQTSPQMLLRFKADVRALKPAAVRRGLLGLDKILRSRAGSRPRRLLHAAHNTGGRDEARADARWRTPHTAGYAMIEPVTQAAIARALAG